MASRYKRCTGVPRLECIGTVAIGNCGFVRSNVLPKPLGNAEFGNEVIPFLKWPMNCSTLPLAVSGQITMIFGDLRGNESRVYGPNRSRPAHAILSRFDFAASKQYSGDPKGTTVW